MRCKAARSTCLRIKPASDAKGSAWCAASPQPSGLHPRRLRSVYPGAIVATFLWWLTTTLFGWYVRNIANYNVLYGSVGAAIALLVWMYLLSMIALFGCELNAQLDRLQHEAM